ncbi:rRNA maturation RNase YbeY [Acuticoccus mangrovi]|uniref:Endoribonuclease YbeY n=1 Tax=Acuticoccus mangrovi TaxID=2796142 RepID=A0A934MII5_9HYPH|nr:rRNA maturation RNase YbeY [Acuticoccus mangrovi]MBJ3777236.1 rRNA maturation RNase YbeY [Acuticoccus mangrovi]
MTPTLDEDVTAGPQSMPASVRVADPRWSAVDPVAIADRVLTAVAGSIAAPEGVASLDILYADDAEVTALNGRYRHKPRPTNVLAFPSGEPCEGDEPCFLGGVILAFDTVANEAGERGIPIADHATHLTLHGVLHLLGYDHEIETDRAEMERTEVSILKGLGIADPYEGS